MPFEVAPKTEEQQRIEMGRIALEAIARYIVTVPPERFNMNKWCGTAQCAIGHGCGLPEVQATGLWLKPTPIAGDTQTHYPALGDKLAVPAIAEALAMPEWAARDLFSSLGAIHRSPEEVAQRIRDYLDGKLEAPHPLSFYVDVGSVRTFTFHEWIAPLRAEPPKPKSQPAKKVRKSARSGATWPVPKGCYA